MIGKYLYKLVHDTKDKVDDLEPTIKGLKIRADVNCERVSSLMDRVTALEDASIVSAARARGIDLPPLAYGTCGFGKTYYVKHIMKVVPAFNYGDRVRFPTPFKTGALSFGMVIPRPVGANMDCPSLVWVIQRNGKIYGINRDTLTLVRRVS